MQNRNFRIFPIVAICATLSMAQAAVGDKATLPDFNQNSHLYGSTVKAKDLRGKVIFFEYWGINCPPCRASMPHLQALQAKYQAKGFTVIGSHMQGSSPEIQKFLKQSKITFPIYQGVSISEAQCPGGIPHAVLIGANGKIVATGSPSSLYDKVEAEMAKVTSGYAILGGLELKKYKGLSKIVVSTGKNIEAKIAPLREKTDDTEAAEICKTFDAWIEDEKCTIQGLCDTNPLEAVVSINRLKTAVPSINDFNEQMGEFQKSNGLKKLFDVQKKVKALQTTRDKGKPVSATSVNSIKQLLEQAQKSSDVHVQHSATALMEEVSSIEPAAKR